MTIQTLFKPDGPLASHIDGFKARAPQLEMAEAVARAIKEHGRLLVEAGTGTGKTYAYLVPALESGKRVVISTGSKNLQEQLFYRDLPTITGRSPTPAGGPAQGAQQLSLHRADEPAAQRIPSAKTGSAQ
ncbi:DEAD/DEAH box helicase [Aeromonas hydrophila]|uniref:DEAD/DEAH box helicase n=1 Tax=Aeromonas hydrophila TaxID=644 RepID=A0A926FPT4_AERHY|nr:DEAD/DEAH box helicase [Aeromonas hydrophila]